MRTQEIGLFLKRGHFYILALILSAGSCFAASKKSRFRLDLNAGPSYQSFSGVSGASFTSITRMAYSAALFYRYRPWWDNGFQYTLIPKITISPFIFSDNVVGAYAAKFSQFEYLTGIVRKKYRTHLIVGLEHFALVGTPELVRGKQFKLYYGGQFSYDVFGRHMLRIPAMLRVLYKPQRTYEFTNRPDDPISVKSGVEVAFMTGLDFVY